MWKHWSPTTVCCYALPDLNPRFRSKHIFKSSISIEYIFVIK
jgi:hypothetical protein